MNNKSSTSIYLFLEDITLDGGVERVVVNMANEFAVNYNEVHIVSNFQKNRHIKYPINDLVKIHYVHNNISLDDWKSKHFLNFLFRSWFIYKTILSFGFTTKLYDYVLKTKDNDKKAIIMFHGYDTAWYKKRNIKLVGVDHSNFPFYKKKSFFYSKIKFPIISFMNRKLDIVTILTDAEIEYWNMLNRPVYVMPNFIPNIPEKVPSIEIRNNTLVSMGRMNTNQKGFDRLIKAFSKIENNFPDWELIIYGDGKLKQEYQKLIDDFNLNKKIKIEGFTDNPNEVFKKNSIYVMCSRTEGFGLVLAEAMGCGMAVVSYDNTGPSSIIKNDETGHVVPNGDESMLCDKLEHLMSNLELRQRFSEKGRADILYRYSTESITSKWYKIFHSLTENIIC